VTTLAAILVQFFMTSSKRFPLESGSAMGFQGS